MKEQEIEEAAKEYYPEAKYACTQSTLHNFRRKRNDNIDAFKAGAHWALESQWIDVETELPNEQGNYITIDEQGDVSIDLFGIKENDFDSVGWITHWMPLPEKPKS